MIADKDGEKSFYHLLAKDKEIIEREMGSVLEWRENPEKNRSSILLFFSVNPSEEQKWTSQHDWMKTALGVVGVVDEAAGKYYRKLLKANK